MISVIVPVYNGEAHLEACIGSILNQTHSDLEILLIDDGSTDKTPAICCRLAGEDGRIRLFHQENAGVSAARNRGLAEARGSYVTFVDADDLLPPTALACLRKGMETGADFVIGSHTLFRGWWEKRVIRTPRDSVDSLMSLMCGKLYRRGHIETNHIRFREDLPYGEDTVFNLQYHKCAPKKVVLSDVVYRCRMGGIASSVRYYPNRDRIALTLLAAYGEYCELSPGDLKRLVHNEVTGMTLHYLVHRNLTEARSRLDGILPSLPQCCGITDGEKMMRTILGKHWLRILLRKVKKRIKGCAV